MSMSHRPYFDHHSTTAVSHEVFEAMRPFFQDRFGNPAVLTHRHGLDASVAVEAARERLSEALGGIDPKRVVFTSGATESNALILHGVLRAALRSASSQPPVLIISAVEHPSISKNADLLERDGVEVVRIGVNPCGTIRMEEFSNISDETWSRVQLISVMMANNEVGAIQPIREIAAMARARGVLFHSDIAQAIGKTAVSIDELGCDFASFSAHKFSGPKGIGALILPKDPSKRELEPLYEGGGQEDGVRSGTLNVPGIVGLATALALAHERLIKFAQNASELRERFWTGLQARLEEHGGLGRDVVSLCGPPLNSERRLPNNLYFIVNHRLFDTIVQDCAGFSFSSTAACASRKAQPSLTLQAMGYDPVSAMRGMRLAFALSNTPAEVDHAVKILAEAIVRASQWMPGDSPTPLKCVSDLNSI